MPTPYEKEMERLLKLLAAVRTGKDSDFDNEDKGPDDILKENFSGHESFSEHDTKSEKHGDSGNEEFVAVLPESKTYCFTMPTSYEKEMERLRKLFTEVETGEDSDFDNEDNLLEDILEANFSDHGSFSERDTESGEDWIRESEEIL
ncbi:hypothetical protein AVEN_245392-1 [Araneus ventricosus]|uniref:Uncharacterized protein n=1 Tax=Araneus ventricosus TaxID=182803 RepID=A0A4Y2M7J5_ARAVE|nr:hypothetical protein AVEN_245392-1 [Araneus ventricosus]